MDVDELVGEDAAVVGLGRRPRDVAGGVPLVALGLFVEAPHVLGLHGVVELEHGVDRSADHASVHEVLLDRKPGRSVSELSSFYHGGARAVK